MFGIELTSTDVWTLVAIVLLIVALAFLAMAETALNRISKVKAQAMADATGNRSTRALAALASQPERFLNALLVTVTICQTAQAFLTSILAARLFGTVGVIVAFILNVIVFFVLGRGRAEDLRRAPSRAGRAHQHADHRRARPFPAPAAHLQGR